MVEVANQKVLQTHQHSYPPCRNKASDTRREAHATSLLVIVGTAGTGWAHIHQNKLRGIAHFMGYNAREWSITEKLEGFQASEMRPFLWDGTREIIVAEQQGGQLGQCPNFGR